VTVMFSIPPGFAADSGEPAAPARAAPTDWID
jgi:hypothetical protein